MNCLEGIHPARGLAFIRHIETAETYAGSSIIIPVQTRDNVAKQQFIVVSVGNYERCEDIEECNRPHTKAGEHKHRLEVGDWVVCRNRSWIASPDPDVYIIRVNDILGVFREV